VYKEFCRQIEDGGFSGQVEIISKKDNKEMSIGQKRQWMLENATGEYYVNFDDDDHPFPFYLSEIMKALELNPDCVGFLIHMTTNGVKPQTCCHSLRYKQWANKSGSYDYVRNVTHFNPVKRSLALQVGFKDMRFGEDKDYADRITPLCQNEVFIPRKLFHYRFIQQFNHNDKYGIK
jgi:hypothetical protein